MYSLSLLSFVLMGLCLVNSQVTGINSGTSFYALRYPDAGQASVTLPDSLSTALPLSFTFEAWIMLPGTVPDNENTTADGLYKTIVSRYAVRPDGTYHNRYADFNFQVQKTGNINFFMGSGLEPNYYGVIITPSFLPAARWTHLAFSVFTEDGATNPSYATVYVDGVAFTASWRTGDRQLREDVPLHLGAYLNQDGDVKWWRGFMDEVRIWAGYRDESMIMEYMNMDVAPNTGNLLAYYKCDEGNVLVDETGQYDGQFVSGAGSVTYQLSGVKLGFEVEVGRQGRVDIELQGVATVDFYYVIETVPDPSVGRLLVDGSIIFSDNVPFKLSGNVVTFEAADVEEGSTTFTYYGANEEGREEGSAPVMVTIGGAPCNPDSCGVCNGDDSTCSCLEVPYKGYEISELENILLLYEIDQTVDILKQILIQIEQAQDALASSSGAGLEDDVTTIQEFNDDCIDQYLEDIEPLMDELMVEEGDMDMKK